MNLKMKSTFEVEAGWRLVMVPLAETLLFSRESNDSRKLGIRAVQGSWGQQTASCLCRENTEMGYCFRW